MVGILLPVKNSILPPLLFPKERQDLPYAVRGIT